MPYKVFISHAGIDSWVAKQIELQIKKTGAITFMDAANIDIGDKFEENMETELRDSKELVVLITPWSLDRPYIWLEIGGAWMLKLRIIVVLYGISIEEVSKNAKIPILIKEKDIVEINNLDAYFDQLQKRVN